jgi:hypothetical protein
MAAIALLPCHQMILQKAALNDFLIWRFYRNRLDVGRNDS